MSEMITAPDLSAFDVPMDAWTQPFWEAAARGTLLLPQCRECHKFRWPPGPFCPHCRSQAVNWQASGPGRIYSYTVIRGPADTPVGRTVTVPALIEFPEADEVRLVAAIVDTSLDALRIGADVTVGWNQAANAVLPVFRVKT